jgi:hypothetical protein
MYPIGGISKGIASIHTRIEWNCNRVIFSKSKKRKGEEEKRAEAGGVGNLWKGARTYIVPCQNAVKKLNCSNHD